jgi:hypothetical protein
VRPFKALWSHGDNVTLSGALGGVNREGLDAGERAPRLGRNAVSARWIGDGVRTSLTLDK